MRYYWLASIILVGILTSFFYVFFTQKKFSMISPVLGVSKVKLAENIWYPKESPKVFSNAPEVTALSAFFVEMNTGEVLYQKNADQRLPIASLTKIMTVIIARENKSLTDSFSVSQKAADMEPDKMLLLPNEKLTMEELLEGIFLVSANDAAEVLAEGVTGNSDEFINLMNQKAQTLGMKNSLFVNPSGLEEDYKKYYSSAFDVALMSRYAIKTYPDLVGITSEPHIYIDRTSNHQDYDLYSGINLLTTYPGVLGFKTGYTPEAGLTLVTLAQRGDKQVLGVLLGAVNRRDDAKVMLDYSFKKLGLPLQ